MPGNIRVAVLEVVDLPATLTAGKSLAVKVAVGKREFQTTPVDAEDGRTQPWNSEFLFPVLNLRDNLIVGILDDKGDVVARAEIETPGIVQKGFQDEFIALKAGGRIHMKVSFCLSEEERKKIDAMRMAAMRKRKGFNQPFRSRRAPLSNVKITEIMSEDTDAAPEPKDSSDVHIRKSPRKEEKLESLSEGKTVPEVSQAMRKPVPDDKPSIPLKVEKCENPRGVPTQKTNVMQPSVTNKAQTADVNVTTDDLSGSKRTGLKWLSGKLRNDQSKLKESRWLEDLKLKSSADKLRAAKAAKADEWIKKLDRQTEQQRPSVPQEPATTEVKYREEGMRLKRHLHEEQRKLEAMSQKNLRQQKESVVSQEHKSVKGTLEEWKLKELGPWRRSSKVRHASPPDSDHDGTKWSLRRKTKADKARRASTKPHEGRQADAGISIDKPELAAEADKLWTSNQFQDSSSACSSPEQQKKSLGGVRSFVKQVVSGAAVVAGSFILWPRKGNSKKKERCHIVKEGETLSSIVPNEWDDPDSDFYRLNPEVVDKHTIYPGQRLRLPD